MKLVGPLSDENVREDVERASQASRQRSSCPRNRGTALSSPPSSCRATMTRNMRPHGLALTTCREPIPYLPIPARQDLGLTPFRIQRLYSRDRSSRMGQEHLGPLGRSSSESPRSWGALSRRA